MSNVTNLHNDLRTAAGLPPDDPRPVIEIAAGELPRMVKQAEAALLKQNAGIYQRAGLLARIKRLEELEKQQGGIIRAAGTSVIELVNNDYLTLMLARSANWQRHDRRAKELRPRDPPEKVAKSLAAISGEWRFPLLSGLIGAPTLRPDGSLLASPGYDAMSGLYGTFDPASFPAINERPTRTQALQALELLRDVFRESPFAAKVDEAVIVAAVITACVRRSLPYAPGFGISAPEASTGKSTIAKAVGQIANGHEPAVVPFPESEAEFKKFLLGVLLKGDNCAVIDNVVRPVESAALCAAMTSEYYSDRLLGVNQNPKLPTNTTWLVTGNGLQFVGDLNSRMLTCSLNAKMERPYERIFERGDLKTYIAEHRGDLIAAALTIPLAYRAAGEPMVDAPGTRFPDWDRMVRRPLLWLGVEDPMKTQARMRGEDPELAALGALLAVWKSSFSLGDAPRTVAEVVKLAERTKQESPELYQAIQATQPDVAGSINRHKLGRYLNRHAERRVNGLHFEIAGEDLVTKCRRIRVVGERKPVQAADATEVVTHAM